MSRFLSIPCLALVCLAQVSTAQTADATAEAEQFFEAKVRPVLANNCYTCHTAAQSGGLRLDSREGIVKGGAHGPAVVPGKADDSLLIKAIKHTHESIQMPPGDKLEDLEIANISKWVEAGAAWPKTDAPVAVAATGYQISPAQKAFWSFQPIHDSAPPKARLAAWEKNAIDAFVLAKLDEKKLRPAPKASKLTLIRRATYDLTGLPPTPEEIDAFLAENTPKAFAKVVDRLLASTAYGERWGRHWLDVVRYSDTAGDASDYPIPQAIQYRDYVIAAFNKDKPYDQFLREQLAGDLIPFSSDAEKWEHIVATGYLAGARRFNVNPLQNMHLTIDDTVDNFGKAILGLTIACARCHDHKFDPIPNRDYFAIYGIFQSTKYPFPGSEKDHKPHDFTPRDKAEYDTVLKPFLDELYKITGKLGKTEGEKRAYVEGARPDRTMANIMADIHDLELQRNEMIAKMPNVAQAYAVSEGSIGNARIQKRGEPKDLGDEAPRGFLEILYGPDKPQLTGSGRLELAKWVTDPKNPQPARVMVNRIWQNHFGKGIVATPNDYGKRGTAPTHPELLDYLAARFVENGWSVKAMHRLIMNSETYQLADVEDPANAEIDADNSYLWKASRQRLDAEALRDSLLTISRKLESGPGGPHPFPNMGTWLFMQHDPFNAVYPTNRRSVYMMSQRIQKNPYLQMFDGADAAISTAQRGTTITPIQALFFMNSELVFNTAGSWSRQLLDSVPNERKRIDNAYRTALGRSATKEETDRALQHIATARQSLEASGTKAADLPAESLASYLRVLLAGNEFLFVD